MKSTLKIFTVILLSLFVSISMTACSLFSGGDSGDSGSSVDTVDTKDDIDPDDLTPEEMEELYDNGIEFEEEMEGADLHFKSSSVDDFLGSWESTSGQSIYMYGNIDIKININGTWKGNVADEDISGTWEFKNPTMELSSEYFNASLSFTNGGKLILQEIREDSDEPINTVLSKKQ